MAAASKSPMFSHLSALMAQSPMVIWMRMPLLLAEMTRWSPGRRSVESERAVIEKMSAGLEAAGKLQIEFARLWAETAIGMMSGRAMPGTTAALRIDHYQETALEPYARRVRGNASRLKRRAVRQKSKS